ncbi:corrinoid protein [Candidatus Merdisoma sp. JLR.KK006]|jgi:Predicted cobalamin binding protein|uniref:corrinoid protein n=1 Tax=Candidatus Merdisoma sp. JLR.KK006 TaxID=3112626 RepID=UPI002FF18689
MTKIEEIAAAIEEGKVKLVMPLIQEALHAGDSPNEILNRGMIDALGNVGEKYRRGEIFVPEMILAARAMKKGVEVLKPYLASEHPMILGKVIIGTVAGDLHDIGKNLVSMMLENAGFEVVDLGIDVSTQKFIDAVKKHPDASIVALSALLTTTLPAMRETVHGLNGQAFRDRIQIIVGGTPVNEDFAKEIGADGYSSNAAEAVVLVKRLIGA